MSIKVEAIKVFRDKYTDKVFNKGDIFETTKERCAEINGTPLGVFVMEISETDEVIDNESVEVSQEVTNPIQDYVQNQVDETLKSETPVEDKAPKKTTKTTKK